MSRIIDISLTLEPGLTVWQGDPPLELPRVKKIAEGDEYNLTFFNSSVHTGTHVDATCHFLIDGTGVETLPLDVLMGPAEVIQIPDEVGLITAEVVRSCKIPPQTTRVLFKTRNSHYWEKGIREFQPDFVALSTDGAEEIVRLGIRLVGIDYLSISPFQDAVGPHQALLRAGVIPLESLDLSKVTPGKYELICLPLKIADSDGAPARAVLIAD